MPSDDEINLSCFLSRQTVAFVVLPILLFKNSNLVLQVDFNFTDRRGRDEPTGEVMPLTKAILSGVKMGDKYQRAKAQLPDQKKVKRYL